MGRPGGVGQEGTGPRQSGPEILSVQRILPAPLAPSAPVPTPSLALSVLLDSHQDPQRFTKAEKPRAVLFIFHFSSLGSGFFPPTPTPRRPTSSSAPGPSRCLSLLDSTSRTPPLSPGHWWPPLGAGCRAARADANVCFCFHMHQSRSKIDCSLVVLHF